MTSIESVTLEAADPTAAEQFPSTVSSLFDSAIVAGATMLKPVEKSLWGYGGVVRAPDGSIWKVATSAKKDAAGVSPDGTGSHRLVISSDAGSFADPDGFVWESAPV
jgi:predicted lactoylglutathione lyase